MGLDHAQRMAALEGANHVRTARKQIKRALLVGEQDARDLIESPPDVVKRAKIGDVLPWLPRVGKVKTRKILAATKTPPSVPLGKLSPVTRRSIIEQLPPALRQS